jgi:hypothetical protein
MAVIDSSDVVLKYNSSALTAVEDCNGIQLEWATSDSLPFGADLKRKRVVGVLIPGDVTGKVPLDDTGGSDYMLLHADCVAKTARTFEVECGATISRQLTMTCIKCDPILAGGDVTMAEFTLVNTGATLTET